MNPIVGIGELLWDVYPDGRKVAGGAPFNFAFHCHQLGHPAVIVSRVGDDDLGRDLREEVRRLGLSDEHIQTDREHPTGTVRVTLDENKVPTYTITENVAWDFIECGDDLGRLADEAAAACFGTLAQRDDITAATVAALVGRVLENPEKPTVFDVNLRQDYYSKRRFLDSLRLSRWIKVNDEELATAVGLFDLSWSSDEKVLWQIRNLPALIATYGEEWRGYQPGNLVRGTGGAKHELDLACVTRGGQGCFIQFESWSEADRQRVEVEHFGVPSQIVDTVGAGDAFTAAMVCLYLEGRPLRDCARFANYYAARVCEHQGATPRINRADVERAALGPP
jgi:fructokinase